ncbi:ion transporter [Curvibacter sp. HBC61]|uniref:Ion transporter n=1 Tax=Curvibacter cyanobacteriorum TaxID=3026422 RepID=A0ABT5MTE4_9BURK|nr:ion transporter [Curvibacter sp. HBC61]MDD0837304.1 ion transporter [Curvibacter sp. HBC61]
MTRSPSPSSAPQHALSPWRERLFRIIFEADTPAGRYFDYALFGLIVLSVGVVLADSVQSLRLAHGGVFNQLEWFFTALFTLEYIARLVCVRHPWRYATSFFGVVDLLALLPTYLALFVPELHLLIDVRVMRLLRVFRIFKLSAYVSEYQSLGRALVATRRKILIFLSVVMMIVLVVGTVMHLVEGAENGFSSIPTSMYWAITTMTTVGFGDITPKTDLGRFISSAMMLLGWGTLAVPTGIVSSEMAQQRRDSLPPPTTRRCHECLTEGHLMEARFCLHCGAELPPP